MRPLIDYIDKIIYKIYEKKNPLLAELITNWKKIVGEELAKISHPIKLQNSAANKKNNILYVSASNSSVSLELTYKQDIMIERIAVYFGYKLVGKIRVLVRE